jgi:regulator of sigma E protease
MALIYSITGFIIGIGLLIIVHELGHFIAARLFNIRVERFSVGFGPCKPIWYDRYGTEYVISAIPLGGYVVLPDNIDPSSNYTPLVRMFIVLAGPVTSILFAVILYWLVFVIGISAPIPIIGEVQKNSTAYLAKLKPNLKITKLNNQPVYDWEDITTSLINNIRLNNKFIKLETINRKTAESAEYVLNLNGLNISANQGDLLKTIGLEPFIFIEPYIAEVIPKLPAYDAGIKAGDLIIALDQKPISNGADVSKYLSDKANKKIVIKIKRDQQVLSFNLKPIAKLLNNGKTTGFIGVKYRNSSNYSKELFFIRKYGVIEAFYRAIIKTYNYTILSIYTLVETIVGRGSVKNMAGPFMIGYYAGQSMKHGLEYFLNFLGLISIGIGVLNLLPIPWLDGGSLVYCWYELLTGKKASIKLINLARAIGLIFLGLLTIIIFINDLSRF